MNESMLELVNQIRMKNFDINPRLNDETWWRARLRE